MPNICNNRITITFKTEKDMSVFLDKFNECHKIIKEGCLGIIFLIETSWEPNFWWLENTIMNFDCWLKNEWIEEGGTAGVWIGFTENGKNNIKSLVWNDLSIEDEYNIFKKN